MNLKKKLSLDIKKDDHDFKEMLLSDPKDTPKVPNLYSVDPHFSKITRE